MPIIQKARDLSSELGVFGTHVFFNDSWVDYEERQNYLLEADLGVSTHRSHIETTFSFRTRILDYLWASLPMVVTEGDHFADLVEKHNLGITVPAGDVQALAHALEQAIFDDTVREEARSSVVHVRESYRWSQVLAPLVRHVESLSEPTYTPRPKIIRYSPVRKRAPRFSIRDIGRGFERLFRGEFRSLTRALRRKLFRRA
jgi:hypothetical protein